MRNSGIVIWLLILFFLFSPVWIHAGNSASLCVVGPTRCFNSDDEVVRDGETAASALIPDGMVPLRIRKAMWGGPFAHKWIQVGTSDQAVTIGYGPANLPFVDAGQVLVVDRSGLELVSRWHLFPGHFTPAERPGAGKPIGNPILVTSAQAQDLVQRQRRHRLVPLYIPLFYDCHTFVCAVTAKVQGKSTVPCYLFFKGHW